MSSQQDYLRQISLKMVSVERKTQPLHQDTVQQHQLLQQQRVRWLPSIKTAEECIEVLERMHSRKFNNEQCDYLVDKLKVVIRSANSFLEVTGAEAHRSDSSVDISRQIETCLKRLPALAIQIKSFVEGCCKDAWLQSAMTLTNMAEHVSSIGFEYCRIDICKEPESLTLDQVVDIYKAEFEIVKKKAASDVETLLARLRSERSSFRGWENDLANYLLQRLSRVQANGASFTSGSSLGAVNEESLWKRLSKWVKPTERLGKGSAATVHKATWLAIQVAKKTFEGHENPDFMKEVGILGRLYHPNITSMFCCDKATNNRWCAIIMELIDGDLHDLMRQRCNENNDSHWPFTILEAVDIMHQISEGVKYLHDQKIVHRDLKSFNILVKAVKAKGSRIEYVHAKVADFGLSKTKESSISYSTQTFNTGTNRWMAPEVINLNVGGQGTTMKPKYPFKCDVYSFAMLCYEVLTGYEPFYEERSLSKVKEKVLKGERPNLPDHCPPSLKELIERCWAQEPKERPSFADICSELKYLKYLLMIGKNLQLLVTAKRDDVDFVLISKFVSLC